MRLQDLLDDKSSSLSERESRLNRIQRELAQTVEELKSVHTTLVERVVAHEKETGRDFVHRGRRLLDVIASQSVA